MVETNTDQPLDRSPPLTRRKFLKVGVPLALSLFTVSSSVGSSPSVTYQRDSPEKGYDSRYNLKPLASPNQSPDSENVIRDNGYKRQALPTFRIKGINFPSWKVGEYQKPSTIQSLRNISNLEPNFVGIVVTQYQTDINSDSIDSNSNTASDTDLNAIINYTHSLGYSVMLKPQINLSNDLGHWHGQIGQNFNQNQWDRWFSSYTNMITHYADLAEKNGVELFIVGNEYVSSTTSKSSNWSKIIDEVRLRYHGPITYAAHMYDFGSITWWNKLDLLGLNPYYDLTQKVDPTFSELTQAWNNNIAAIEPVVNRWNKILVFPEIGYLSTNGTNIHPWDVALITNPNVSVDLAEQADCIHALYHSLWYKNWWYGVIWWMWDTDPNVGGVNDKGYTPSGKPAANIIKLYNQVKI